MILHVDYSCTSIPRYSIPSAIRFCSTHSMFDGLVLKFRSGGIVNVLRCKIQPASAIHTYAAHVCVSVCVCVCCPCRIFAISNSNKNGTMQWKRNTGTAIEQQLQQVARLPFYSRQDSNAAQFADTQLTKPNSENVQCIRCVCNGNSA